MDSSSPYSSNCVRRDARQPPSRHSRRSVARARKILGQIHPQWPRPSSVDFPPVVTGFILLILFGRRGPIGAFLAEHFGIVLSFRWTGAALACGVMGFPLMVRSIRLSIEAVDRKLEDAAGTLGASPLWVFATVTLPLILPGIIAGMILSFAKAMGEFGATITFVSNIPGETQTLSAAIYTFTQVPGGDAGAFRLTIISVIISMAALMASEFMGYLVGRRVDIE